MSESRSDRLWRYEDGALPYLLAFSYTALSHIFGIALLAVENIWLFIPAVLLVAHSWVIGGYLIHELAHNVVFRSRKMNLLVGECISWFCGSAYAPFDRIQLMHMRHHADRADVALFDHQEFLKNCSKILRHLVYALEWIHIPAVELIMHYQLIVRPFIRADFHQQRLRVVLMASSRIVFFYCVICYQPVDLIGLCHRLSALH